MVTGTLLSWANRRAVPFHTVMPAFPRLYRGFVGAGFSYRALPDAPARSHERQPQIRPR
jgi:hypothetical protein